MASGLNTTMKELIAYLKKTANGQNNGTKKSSTFNPEKLPGQEVKLTCGYPVLRAGMRSLDSSGRRSNLRRSIIAGTPF
jgi:hypothetical protein